MVTLTRLAVDVQSLSGFLHFLSDGLSFSSMPVQLSCMVVSENLSKSENTATESILRPKL